MIDLILLGQVFWCFIWLVKKRLQTALVYAGGVLSAGYVAWQATGLVSKWFVSPSHHAFLWLQQNITVDARAVAILGNFVPPQPVGTTLSESHWVAIHIAKSLVFCAITGAVFVSFVIIAYLRTAIWDLNREAATRADATWMRGIIAAACSLYIGLITVMLITDVAWVRPLHSLTPLISDSLAMHVYALYLRFQ